jgi:hypothetical protein
MATTLMLNPRKRRASRKSGKRAPSAKQRANWARFAKMARARASRSANPSPRRGKRRAARRSNPVVTYRRRSVRRRRNPISLGRSMGGGGLFNFRSYLGPIKDAAIMGAGAVAMDMAYAYATPYLPAALQRVPGKLGMGDLAKMILTVAFGKLLSKPTRGLSMKAAQGALVVQARDIALTFVPTPAPTVAGLRGLGALPSAGAAYPGAGLRRNWTGTGMATPSGIGQVVRGRAPLVQAPRAAQLSAFYVGSPQLSVGRR